MYAINEDCLSHFFVLELNRAFSIPTLHLFLSLPLLFESIDVFGPISNDHRATPEPTQDYRHDSQRRWAGSAIEEEREPAVG